MSRIMLITQPVWACPGSEGDLPLHIISFSKGERSAFAAWRRGSGGVVLHSVMLRLPVMLYFL